MITLGNNIASLRGIRQLTNANNSLAKVFERLSTGQRINRASDDAAGLAIADSLRADSRVYTQAIRNVNDGISLLNIADQALAQLTTVTDRLTELAEQAANGVYSLEQRTALDNEADSLVAEYNRIVATTNFNDRDLLTSNSQEIRIQAGYGVEGSLAFTLGASISRSGGDGTFQDAITFSGNSNSYSVVAADFNGDGADDIVNLTNTEVLLYLSNGDGTLASPTAISPTGGGFSLLASADLNDDGNQDVVYGNGNADRIFVLEGNGDGTFQSSVSYEAGDVGVGSSGQSLLELADVNGDGELDVVSIARAEGVFNVFLGNGDGTLQARTSFSIAGSGSINFDLADFDGDNDLDIAIVNDGSDTIETFLNNGSGVFSSSQTFSVSAFARAVRAGDFDQDGTVDLITSASLGFEIISGNGDGTFSGSTTIYSTATQVSQLLDADFNSDGITDVITGLNFGGPTYVFLGTADGSFEDPVAYQNDDGVTGNNGWTLADINNDNALDVIFASTGANGISAFLGNTNQLVSIEQINLTSQETARQALDDLAAIRDNLLTERGNIGAFQSRLDVAAEVLRVSNESFLAAESRIRDADIAKESSELVRLSILQQASAAVLAQANQQPALALQLLR